MTSNFGLLLGQNGCFLKGKHILAEFPYAYGAKFLIQNSLNKLWFYTYIINSLFPQLQLLQKNI